MQPRMWKRVGVLAALVSIGVVSACSEDTEGAAGAECDPAQADSCQEGLECTTSGDRSTCTFPVGGDCRPNELENGGCPANAECAAGEGAGPKCLLREGESCEPTANLCSPALACAELVDGGHRCFPAVVLRGDVRDARSETPLEGAHVIALDDEGVAVTDVAVSDAAGHYSLRVPVPREADGAPTDEAFTLSAAAADHQPFPSGIRVALPITTSTAKLTDGAWLVDNALTRVVLLPLPSGQRYSIEGRLVGASAEGTDARRFGGVLVVAAGTPGAFSGLSDRSGTFTIFNVVPGEYELRGYAAGLQLEPETVTVASKSLAGVELVERDRPTTTVSGTIQLVNAPGDAATSVILVVKDTFDDSTARGETPRGLRAPETGDPNVDGAFGIEGVPDGTYVVLAAYENDALVRDPDTNIAGTSFVTIDVDADESTTLEISESFKVTGALEVLGPGTDDAEPVSEQPALRWADDSSEDYYEVRVFDAFGNEVWSVPNLPGVSGSEEVSVAYDGPLDSGMYYQFRVKSWRQPGNGDPAPISTTEDLRGVFFKPAE